MEIVVESSLSLIRAQDGGARKCDVDIGALLSTIVDNFVDSGADVDFSGPMHLKLHCDPALMTRAIENVVDNALKFAGRAEVSLRAEPHQAVIEVRRRWPGHQRRPENPRLRSLLPRRRIPRRDQRQRPGPGHHQSPGESPWRHCGLAGRAAERTYRKDAAAGGVRLCARTGIIANAPSGQTHLLAGARGGWRPSRARPGGWYHASVGRVLAAAALTPPAFRKRHL